MAVLSTPLQYLTSVPPATRTLAVLLIVFPAAYRWLEFSHYEPANYFLLIPGFFWLRPWTLVTAALIEINIFEARSAFARYSHR